MPISSPDSYLHWVNCAKAVAQIGFVSSTVFCFLLIFLTLFGVKRDFGSYKYLLITFPTVGIFFATLEVIVYPQVHSYNTGYLCYSTSRPFNISKDAVTWCLAFYAGIYASTIAMITVQFVYRYWANFNEHKLRYFKGWNLLIWVGYILFFGFLYAFGAYYFDMIDDYSTEYFKVEMLERYGIDTSDVAGIALVAYDSNGDFRYFNLCCVACMTTIMSIQYSVIIYCAINMYQDMEEKLHLLSASLRSLHKQFFKTLILQITTPTIFLFSPIILINYLPLLNLNVTIPTGIFLCLLNVYPAMDALIVMYIVTDYRKAARRLLMKFMDYMYAWLNRAEAEGTSQVTRSTPGQSPAVLIEMS